MPKRYRLAVKKVRSGFQMVKTKWWPFESRTQKVSERWPFECRIVRLSDVYCTYNGYLNETVFANPLTDPNQSCITYLNKLFLTLLHNVNYGKNAIKNLVKTL
jgi:hypothetical protein